jgi:hypothetical protein
MSLTREIEKTSRRANLMGDAMLEHRQRSGELRDPERSERKSVRVHSNAIPRRGVLDEDGTIFSGFKGDIIEVNGISNAELGPDAVLNANIGEQINANKLPNIGGLGGDLPLDKLPSNIPDSKLGNIGKPKIPKDIIYGDGGKAHRGQIADFLNGDRLIKDGTLPLTALTGRPWASKTDAGQVRRIARKIAKDVVRDMVKATSLKGG